MVPPSRIRPSLPGTYSHDHEERSIPTFGSASFVIAFHVREVPPRLGGAVGGIQSVG
jgi:hypothetical protein